MTGIKNAPTAELRYALIDADSDEAGHIRRELNLRENLWRQIRADADTEATFQEGLP